MRSTVNGDLELRPGQGRRGKVRMWRDFALEMLWKSGVIVGGILSLILLLWLSLKLWEWLDQQGPLP